MSRSIVSMAFFSFLPLSLSISICRLYQFRDPQETRNLAVGRAAEGPNEGNYLLIIKLLIYAAKWRAGARVLPLVIKSAKCSVR